MSSGRRGGSLAAACMIEAEAGVTDQKTFHEEIDVDPPQYSGTPAAGVRGIKPEYPEVRLGDLSVRAGDLKEILWESAQEILV